jgi:MoaA/NifB/PqqE/SkfB family radical SAM enzyme
MIADTFSLAGSLYARWAGENPRRRKQAQDLRRALEAADDQRRRRAARLDVPLPETLVVSLTSACDLRCPGCAAAPGFALPPRALRRSLLDDVVAQSRTLGVGRFAIVGGEPLLRADELLRLTREHRDCLFLVFTNGLRLDDALCTALAAHGNVLLFVNVGASAPRTAVEALPERLARALASAARGGLPFAFAATVTRDNLAFLSSTRTLDLLHEGGAAGGIYFDRLADLEEAVPQSGVRADERGALLRRVRAWAARRGSLVVAVPEDERLLGGCGAGGRALLHLSAHGTYEPCPFVPFTAFHAERVSLLEALRSPYFGELRAATAAPSDGCAVRERLPQLHAINARHGAVRSGVDAAR